jgi:uncharacterized protein
MTVVLDTNVVLSAILFGGKPRQILESILAGSIRMAVSEPLLDELRGVLQRPQFGLSSHVVRLIVSEYASIGTWIEPSEHFNVVRDDPSDNAFIDCAFASKADFLVTGDKHLLSLDAFRATKIIAVEQFVEVLRAEERPKQ